MKAPPFLYARPSRLAEACAILAANDEAQILAGGQSLMATLNMRLARPPLLIDINRVTDFAGLEPTDDGGLRVGALVRHAEMASSVLVAQRAPLIALAMQHVAHLAIRNRGTHCGSLALADPAAEMPACAITLGGVLTLVSEGGTREVPAEDYFLGPYETPRAADEILAQIRYPAPAAGLRTGFGEIAVRHGDFPLIGIAATARVEDGCFHDLRLVTFGCEPSPRLSAVAADTAEGRPADAATIAGIADAVAADIDPMDAEAVRRVQAATLVRRVLQELLA